MAKKNNEPATMAGDPHPQPISQGEMGAESGVNEELEALKRENFNLKVLSQLDKAGCLKSDLVMKSVPTDCDDIPKWVENFKSENEILFKQPPKSFGGTFKPASANVLSPKEVMNDFIRNYRR